MLQATHSSTAIRSPRGLVGYVPSDAFDAATDIISIDVDLLVRSGKRVQVRVPTKLRSLEYQLLDERNGGMTGILTWLGDRAITRYQLAHPAEDHKNSRVIAIYWVCGRRREPFLR